LTIKNAPQSGCNLFGIRVTEDFFQKQWTAKLSKTGHFCPFGRPLTGGHLSAEHDN
jgi:hypothetical protein